MTEMTNPSPSDPGGASAMPEDSTLVDGSASLLDGGSTGTEEGPGGVPAALVGHDRDGDEVAPPPAAGPDSEPDARPAPDTSPPQRVSEGRSEGAS